MSSAVTPESAGWRRLAQVALGVAALFALTNAVLFYAGAYQRVLDPTSSTATFDRAVDRMQAWPSDPSRDVLVMGDSRIYSGLVPGAASRAGSPWRLLNAGVPGTTPRCWFYYLRAVDPGANRFRALVLPVDSLTDDTSAIGSLDAADHAADLHYIVFHTTPVDALAIASSFEAPGVARDVALNLVLRGPILRDDVQSLLKNPAARAQALRDGGGYDFDPVAAHPRTEHLERLRADFAKNTLVLPPWVDAAERVEMQKQILAQPQPSESYARYRARWLGAIVQRYRAAGVPVIFVRIPSRPIHRSEPAPPSGSIVTLARTFGAHIVAQAAYVRLEQPALFADHDHLDAKGALLFSRLLGTDVAAILTAQPPQAVSENAAAVPIAQPSASPLHRLLAWSGYGVPLVFASADFALFFAVVVALFYFAPKRLRPLVLLIASWYFYARWNAWYLVLLIGLTCIDYAIALLIERSAGRARRTFLTVGVGANLLFLGTFKYYNFFSANVAAALGRPAEPWMLSVLVPLGISFHTFQSISYLVDVSRAKVRAVRDFIAYALYIGFFPQLLAGPIVRAARFFGELFDWHAPGAGGVARGVREIALGLIKKLAIADQFAPYADAYFGAVNAHPGMAAAWTGTFAFAMQIYFDFSGYSDIAIGTARLLGFAFPQNFARPYLAWSITEFWRRWNITLSEWLRDYLYIPLGGNRHGTLATMRNLMITMLLGGLWHGANWTFVAWGGYHGALLAAERLLGNRPDAVPRLPLRLIRTLLTFGLVSIGWVLFRAQTFSIAGDVLRALVAGGPGTLDVALWPFALVAVALAIGIAQERNPRLRWKALPAAITIPAAAGGLLIVELCSWPGPAQSFVYFKF
jgi:alginate O-acetyltransferase complex protein AlgI